MHSWIYVWIERVMDIWIYGGIDGCLMNTWKMFSK
jgi:hypothetical protein